MSRGARLWLAYGGGAVIATGFAVALVLTSDHESQPALALVFGELVGLSFILAGLLGVWRRPGNNTGHILALVGFAYAATALSEANVSILSTLGFAVQQVFIAAFLHLLLAYPSGTLTRGERRVVVSSYAAALVFPTLYLMVARQPGGCRGCPPSAFTVYASTPLRSVIQAVAVVAAFALLAIAAVLLVRRWRSATPAYKSNFRPVLLCGGITLGLLGVRLPLEPVAPHTVDVVLQALAGIAFLTVPYAFAAGLIRGRFAGAAVGRLVADLGPAPAPGRLRDSLREALGDPALELGYWRAEPPGYVDIDGRPFEPGPIGVATIVDGAVGRIGVLVHDPALLEQHDLLDAVLAAARLALENERLHAELRAQLAELQRERDFTRLVVNTAPSYFCVVDADGLIVRFNRTLTETTGIVDDPNVQGLPFWEVFAGPPAYDQIRAAIHRTASTGATSRHENELTAADGTTRAVSWIDVSIPDATREGAPYVLVSGLDVTERRWHEDVQAALRHVATLVAAGTGEADLMDAVTAEVGQLFGAHSAHLLQVEGETSRIVGGWAGPGATAWAAGTDFPIEGDTATGRAIRSGRPERVDSPDELGDDFARDIWRQHGFQSTLAAPIVVESALWGVISVSRSTSELFPAEAEERLGDFAALVAQAVANAAAREELRASRARLVAAGDAERKKLERNLHDGAQQRLVSVSIALRLAQAKIQGAPDDAAAIVRGASEELGHALDELRELARGIHPAVLTDRGLTPALRALAERAPLPVAVDSDLADRLPSPVEAAAYYVVSESLANVAKYACASEVAVHVSCRSGVAFVEVRDDGIGGADPSLGSGLRGLADRVEALDGRLGVESAPAAGTRIWAEIPFAAGVA